jgi:hypothetical protein
MHLTVITGGFVFAKGTGVESFVGINQKLGTIRAKPVLALMMSLTIQLQHFVDG